jgi:hypothetical protein
MDNPINIIGMSSLINKNEINKKMDIKEIENEFINKNSAFQNFSMSKNNEYISIEDYQNKLKNINTITTNDYSHNTYKEETPSYQQNNTYQENNSYQNNGLKSFNNDYSFDKESVYSMQPDFDDTKSIISQLNDLDKELNNINLDNFHLPSDNHKSNNDPFLARMTNEQHNQNIVNTALGNDYDDNEIDFDIDQESKDEKKLMLLEKIEDIRSELIEENINVDKVPVVDHLSDLESIEYAHRVYMIKYNRHRFSGFAEEFILTGAGLMETVFNGQNEFLGLKPDLTDYSDTVRIKLRRLRHETSTIMGGVMDQYDIGPVTRILIELIPSMFLHAKLNKSQYKNNIYPDVNLNQAISDIRSLE